MAVLLERFRLYIRKYVQTNIVGIHRGILPGVSMDFLDHRQYVAGDDLRYLDWNVYARHNGMFIKQFLAREAAKVAVVVDSSQSMQFGTPSKLAVAKIVAQAVAYVTLNSQDSLSFCLLDTTGFAVSPVYSGKNSIVNALSYVENARSPSQATGQETNFREFVSRYDSILIVSDFYWEPSFSHTLEAVAPNKILNLVFVMSSEEMNPDIVTVRNLVDSESGETVKGIGSEHLAYYRDAVERHISELRKYASKRRGGFCHILNTMPLQEIIYSLMGQTVFSMR